MSGPFKDSQQYADLLRPTHRAKTDARVNLRQPDAVQTPDIEKESGKYTALALVAIHKALMKIAVMAQDYSKPVDEYAPQTLSPESENTLSLQPQWEIPEKIESILITGPAGVVTLQLGDRLWALTIPAAGFIFLGAPLAIYLNRDDPRILTISTPGQYTLELMGHADTRGNLI